MTCNTYEGDHQGRRVDTASSFLVSHNEILAVFCSHLLNISWIRELFESISGLIR